MGLDRVSAGSSVFNLATLGRPPLSDAWCSGYPRNQSSGGEMCAALDWQCPGAAAGVAGLVDVSCEAKRNTGDGGIMCQIKSGCSE